GARQLRARKARAAGEHVGGVGVAVDAAGGVRRFRHHAVRPGEAHAAARGVRYLLQLLVGIREIPRNALLIAPLQDVTIRIVGFGALLLVAQRVGAVGV